MAVSYAQAGAAELFLTARAVPSLEDTTQAVHVANSSTQVRAYSLDLMQQDQTQKIMQMILQVTYPSSACFPGHLPSLKHIHGFQ